MTAIPSVFAYLDYIPFLQEWLRHRREVEPGYSHARFAEAGGCSRSALSNVLSSSRVPRPDTLDAFARAMGLSPRERNFLGLLVDFGSARDVPARSAAMNRILLAKPGLLRQAEEEPPKDVMRFFEHWYLPAIFELAGHAIFRADAAWIASILNPPITAEQAGQALSTLIELGYLEHQLDGVFRRVPARVQSDAESGQAGVAHFHRDQIPLLMKGIDPKTGDTRHLLANTITLSEAVLPEVKAEMFALLERIATRADAAESTRSPVVYILAMQLLPVTTPIDG